MISLAQSISKSNLKVTVLIGQGIFLLIIGVISLSQGAFAISLSQSISILLSEIGIQLSDFSSQQANVLLQIRLPRILLATLVGGGLGISGAALQGLFRNPLVEPGLIGVSSGSALFAVIFLVFAPTTIALSWIQNLGMPLFAFLGGLIHVVAVYLLGQSSNKTNTNNLILAGVAINALAGALIGLTLFYSDDAAIRSFTFWSLGDLGGATWEKMPTATILIAIPSLLLFSHSKNLNAISLGEQEAFHMGINVPALKVKLLLITALIVGVAVSLTGMIGFVGLVVPHLIRITFGADHKLLLPASFLLGAILLNVADLLARTIAIPAELPIGVITALLGAPFFIYLISNFNSSKN